MRLDRAVKEPNQLLQVALDSAKVLSACNRDKDGSNVALYPRVKGASRGTTVMAVERRLSLGDELVCKLRE